MQFRPQSVPINPQLMAFGQIQKRVQSQQNPTTDMCLLAPKNLRSAYACFRRMMFVKMKARMPQAKMVEVSVKLT